MGACRPDQPTPDGSGARVLATVRVAYSFTLALEQERFGGLDAQVTEGREERNRDLRVLSRVGPPGWAPGLGPSQAGLGPMLFS